METKYDNKHICVKYGGNNKIIIKDTLNDDSIISECEIECKKCNHKDYWAYGWYESKQGE